MSAKRQLTKARRQMDECQRITKKLSWAVLGDLYRRGEVEALPDSYPSNSMPEFTTGGGGPEVRTSVEVAVDSRIFAGTGEGDDRIPVNPHDNVGDALREFAGLVGMAFDALAEAERRYEFVMHVDAKARGRQSSIPSCQACGDDVLGRVVSGYDDKCLQRWYRLGRPDRAEFERTIKRERDEVKAS